MEQKLTEVINKNQKVVVSGKREFTLEDAKASTINFLKYSSPVILAMLLALQLGRSWKEVVFAGYALILQNAINLFSKWANEARYVVDKK